MKRWLALVLLLLMLPGAHGEGLNAQEEKTTMIQLTVGVQTFTASLENNETARAFAALLPMTLSMTELNGNEKYHYLLSDLPAQAERVGRIEAGDLMLFGGNCVVLFYESFSTPYSYTRIGRLTDPNGLKAALGQGRAEVAFSLPDQK